MGSGHSEELRARAKLGPYAGGRKLPYAASPVNTARSNRSGTSMQAERAAVDGAVTIGQRGVGAAVAWIR
jgi:hypothetical protein